MHPVSPSFTYEAGDDQQSASRTRSSCQKAPPQRPAPLTSWHLRRLRALAHCDVFRYDFVVTCACQFFYVILELAGAFTLRFVLQETDNRATGKAVGLLFGVVGMFAASCILDTWRLHLITLLNSKLRGTLTTIVHKKSLRLSNRARTIHQLDVGRIMALVNNDVERLAAMTNRLHIAWVAPFVLLVAIAFLCINITYSALPGFAIFIFFALPLAAYANAHSQHLQRKTDVVVKERSTVISTVIYAIRFVKLHVWEHMFADRVMELRARESHLIVRTNFWNTGFHAFMRGISAFAPMLSLVVYSYTGHDLYAPVTFSTLALFTLLMWPVGGWPLSMRDLGQSRLSHDEIQTFLQYEEQDPHYFESDGTVTALRNASFTWEVEEPAVAFTLRDVDVELKPGITAIVGPVGSGKSSLLSALAGEMRKTSGQVILPSVPAYAAQVPWIRNASLRANVIFGSDFDSERYNTVIDACALRHDIDSFPDGDMTEIGEKGVVLSGGQKQRVNLARAIYAKTDIILADDPLSAVDAPIGRHIFRKAIRELSRDRVTVMATHQLQTLESCDHIIWMVDASIRKQGSYPEMMKDEDFRDFIGSRRLARCRETERKMTAMSIASESKAISISQAKQIASRRLITKEDTAVRHVHFNTIATLFTANYRIPITLFVTTSLIICEGLIVLSGLWLAWWIDNRFDHLSTAAYVGILLALSVSVGISSASFGLSSVRLAAHANFELCKQALDGVLRAPMTWFDGQPSGRILARFQSDVMQLDLTGQMAVKSMSQDFGTVIAILILTTAYYYYFAAALIPLFVILTLLVMFTQRTKRELRRIATLQKNQAVSLVQEASTGFQALRQYDRVHMFDGQVSDCLEGLHIARKLEISAQTWVYTWMGVCNLLLVLIAGLLVIYSGATKIGPGVQGVVLSTSFALFQLGRRMVIHYDLLEDTLHSCERLPHYAGDLPREAALTTDVDDTLPENWPASGSVKFNSVSMRYRSHQPLILQDVNLDIQPGEKVGLIGRTGSGKSSMLTALFRMVELASGSIEVDGVDISTIGLEKLRAALSIIPQDPLLLEGTVRTNIDPENKLDDDELQYYLDQATLHDDNEHSSEPNASSAQSHPASRRASNASLNPHADAESSSSSASSSISDLTVASEEEKTFESRLTLQTPISTNGTNLSLGQRQQVSLVRALLQSNSIVVLDEATSSIDSKLDTLLQSRLIHLLRNRTVISIAHRLTTIIGFDKVVVLSRGKVVEADEPVALFDAEGEFRRTCAEAGVSRQDIVAARAAALEERENDAS